MSRNFDDMGTKDDRARRRAAAIGRIAPNDAKWSEKVKARELADEAFARSLGVRLTYGDIRRRVGQVSR